MTVDSDAAHAERPVRIAVVTVSDGVAAGTREDTSGALIGEWIRARGSTLVTRDVVPDAAARLTSKLLALCDAGPGADAVDVVLTTGGTGFTVRDITPEATCAVIEREVPGIPEQLRASGALHTPYATLSRGVAGLRGRTLIVNLPGSTGGVRDGLAVLDEIIDHAVQLLRGENTDRHDPPHG